MQAWLDDVQVQDYIDEQPLKRGYIALQFQSGLIEFRDIMMRPLKRVALSLDEKWTSDWSVIDGSGQGMLVEPTKNGLHVQGGPGHVESKKEWRDFVLQTTYQLSRPDVDTGVLFRCVRGEVDRGYECQINHQISDGVIARPLEGGAGAVSYTSKPSDHPARVVVGDGTKSTHLTVIAEDRQFTTWVNGLQIADQADTREPSNNPRAGSRREGGPIALQGKDPSTDVVFSRMFISVIE